MVPSSSKPIHTAAQAQTSQAFRVSTSILAVALVLLVSEQIFHTGLGSTLVWAAGLLAGAGVFFFSNALLSVFVIGFPSALLIASVVGLMLQR